MATYNADEKHHSDGGSDPKEVHTAHYVLDERRRAALAEIDNAKFSYAPSPLLEFSQFLTRPQVVPCQGVHCRWCRLLYRCVSKNIIFQRHVSHVSLAMISLRKYRTCNFACRS